MNIKSKIDTKKFDIYDAFYGYLIKDVRYFVMKK